MEVSKEEDELPKAVSELRLDSSEPDPWRTAEPDTTPVQAPDPSTAVPETAGELDEKHQSEGTEDNGRHGATDPDVLQSFDPLATSDDQNAWADSESNPPPVPSKSEPDSFSTPSTSTQPLPSSTSDPQPQQPRNFPGTIANIARGFTLPSVNMNIKTLVAGKQRSRPQSMDFATVIQTPTPVSAGSFAQQQMGHERTRSNLVPDDAVAEARGSPKLSGSNIGVDSPRVRAISREASGSRPGSRASGDPPAFDFQRFLDQMKAKSAEPIAKYLRSFLNNFTKRTFTVADQIKLINDFLGFISTKMRDVEPWKTANEQEFENAMEGMEKLVMNRLYDFIFTPQVARAIPPRPITTDDLERDRVLAQRIALFGWIEPRHLDVPVGEGTNGFLMFAQQELIKVNHYKAPRDKLICILNTCKVIFGLIRHLGTAESADTFIPILIFVVLKANPEHLLSNVEFINRFRNPAKLQSEAGYYLSSLMGAVSFIETMDHTSLSNITQEQFEHNVETAIQALPSSRPQSPPISASSSSSSSLATPSTPTRKASPISGLPPPITPTPLPPIQTVVVSPHAGDEPATPLALPAIDAKRLLQRTGDNLSKPLSAIGRIFSEALDSAEDMISQHLPPPPGLGQSTGPQGQGYGPQGQGYGPQGQGYGPQTPGPWVGGTSTPQQGYGQGQGGQGSYAPWVPPPAVQTPYKPRIRRSPANSPAGSYVEESPSRPPRPIPAPAPPINPATIHPSLLSPSSGGQFTPPSRSGTPNPDSELDIAGMQAEIDRAHAQAGDAARGTLRQIFPGVDGEVLGWVLEANEGDLGRSIEALLEMNGGQ
ncbi:hypothetical protein PENSPDRAFT_653400 [Peniophora sp. CONT]|nr:hypothetical protein PENSPDRAFT_653400 [Peniophora sp. CONT]